MNANELRIGNRVNVPNKGQCPFRIDAFEYLSEDFGKVAMGKDKDLHPATWYLSDIDPIPLTPKILEKCGWLWNEECNSFEKYPNGDTRMNLVQKYNGGYTL
jgi:hypothetical protein